MKKMASVFVILAVLPAFCMGAGRRSTGTEAASLPAAEKILVSEWAVKNKLNVYTETVDELYEAAKKEGKVTVYSITSRIPQVKASFEARYPGVTVEAFHIAQDPQYDRITREYEAGIRNADVLHLKDMDGMIYQEKVLPGILINYYPSDICSRIEPRFLQYSMPLYVEIYNWYYNAKLCSEPPIKSWWDLTKPEWKGKFFLQDPLTDVNYFITFTGFLQHTDEFAADYEKVFGEKIKLSPDSPTVVHELFKRLLANDPIFSPGSDETCESVGDPNATVSLVGYGTSSKLRKNDTDGWVLAPIYNITPASSLTNVNNLYIVNEAPHPNAAKLFLRWFTGEADGKGDGFKPMNTLGGWSARSDVIPPAGAAPFSSLGIWPADPNFLYTHLQDFKDFWLSIKK